MKTLKKNKYSIISNILKYSFVFVLAFVLVMPVIAVDHPPCQGKDSNGQYYPVNCDPNIKPGTTTGGPGTTTGGTNISTGIHNPIEGVDDIPSFIGTILHFVLVIGTPIVVLAIIYCGFLFVTAGGNSEKLTKAKKALLYTLIGAALLLGSLVIANAIKGTVDEISNSQ